MISKPKTPILICLTPYSPYSTASQEGALFSRLWNLQTSLMDSELSASRQETQRLGLEVRQLESKVRRQPLKPWLMRPGVFKLRV